MCACRWILNLNLKETCFIHVFLFPRNNFLFACQFLGTLRNYDSNGNAIKATSSISKTTLYMHHAFLYISLPSLHNYDVKWPNFTFIWGRERQGDKFYHICLNLGAVLSLQLQHKFPSFVYFSATFSRTSRLSHRKIPIIHSWLFLQFLRKYKMDWDVSSLISQAERFMGLECRKQALSGNPVLSDWSHIWSNPPNLWQP